MESLKIIFENRIAMIIFGALVLLFSSSYLGIWFVPRHFNEAQMKKILYTAAFTSGVIGAIPIAIVLFFFFEDWFLWGLDKNDQRILLVLAAISGSAYVVVAFFTGVERALKKKLFYKDLGVGYKILAGVALFVGVVGLPGIKALNETPHQYDFYAEEDQDGEELEGFGEKSDLK